jgi:hypothetical protein
MIEERLGTAKGRAWTEGEAFQFGIQNLLLLFSSCCAINRMNKAFGWSIVNKLQ